MIELMQTFKKFEKFSKFSRVNLTISLECCNVMRKLVIRFGNTRRNVNFIRKNPFVLYA